MNELLGEQSRLRQQTSQQFESLQAVGEAGAAEAVAEAVAAQENAEAAMQQSQLDSAVAQAQQAAEELERAARSAAERSQQLDQQAKRQQIFQLMRSLQRLVAEQRPLVEQLMAAADQMDDDSSMSDGQKASIRGLAAEQESVRQELRDVREQSSAIPDSASLQVFDWALEKAEEDMSKAVAATQRFRLRPEAIQASQAALTKLQLAADSLEQQESARQDLPPEMASRQDGEESMMEAERLIPPIASLKLLRGLQSDINERTKQVDASKVSASVRSRALLELTRQQQELGQQLDELVRQLNSSQVGDLQ